MLGLLPPILPADCITIFRMLWEGDVHSNQRRAILQHNATSNHSYTTGKTKRISGGRGKTEINKDKARWQVYNDGEHIHRRKHHIVMHLPNDLVCAQKQLHFSFSLQFPSLAKGNLPEIARMKAINTASPKVKLSTPSHIKTKHIQTNQIGTLHIQY